ncbi:DUF1697 domain-containing protein [Rhodococcus aerolatus]
MARYVAFLRAVNVGRRTVRMARACELLVGLGLDDVSSFVASGNLLLTSRRRATTLERDIRAALEDEWGFEITTFVRTAEQVRALATERPWGEVAPGDTHFVLLPLTPLDAAQRAAVEAMSNHRDEVAVRGGDVHWLIHDRSVETTLGPKQWRDALPGVPTTARNTTMLRRLVTRL